jgi:hypothetical protein
MTAKLGPVYAKMPAAALASLSINALAANDLAEVERIVAAVPRKRYLCLDVAYQWRSDAMQTGLLALSTEYWHATSMMMVCHAWILGFAEDAAKTTLAEIEQADQRYQQWKAHLAGLDAALMAICEHAGLDETTLRTWLRMPPRTGTPTQLTAEGQIAKDERVAVWVRALAGLPL